MSFWFDAKQLTILKVNLYEDSLFDAIERILE